jgi:hypothetical protein
MICWCTLYVVNFTILASKETDSKYCMYPPSCCSVQTTFHPPGGVYRPLLTFHHCYDCLLHLSYSGITSQGTEPMAWNLFSREVVTANLLAHLSADSLSLRPQLSSILSCLSTLTSLGIIVLTEGNIPNYPGSVSQNSRNYLHPYSSTRWCCTVHWIPYPIVICMKPLVHLHVL